jgi:hypothetical protein
MIRVILPGSLALNSVIVVALSDVSYDDIEPADVDASQNTAQNFSLNLCGKDKRMTCSSSIV